MGHDVFFTVDAGPQIKASVYPPAPMRSSDALSNVPGVIKIMRSPLGDGARVIE